MLSGNVVQKNEEQQKRGTKKSYLNQLSATTLTQPPSSKPDNSLPKPRLSYVSAVSSTVHGLIRSPGDQNCSYCAKQNVDVEPQRPITDVVSVVGFLNHKVTVAALRNLP
jgi:hypothetical protein